MMRTRRCLSQQPHRRRASALGLQRVRYAKDHATGVATVAIDRPEVLNAFDFLTLRELGERSRMPPGTTASRWWS